MEAIIFLMSLILNILLLIRVNKLKKELDSLYCSDEELDDVIDSI